MLQTLEIHLYPVLTLWLLVSWSRHESLEVCPSPLTCQKPGIRAAGCLLGFWLRQASQLCSSCTCPRARLALAMGISDWRRMKGREVASLASSPEMDTLAHRLSQASGFTMKWEQPPNISSPSDLSLHHPTLGRATQLPSCTQSGLRLASYPRQSC